MYGVNYLGNTASSGGSNNVSVLFILASFSEGPSDMVAGWQEEKWVSTLLGWQLQLEAVSTFPRVPMKHTLGTSVGPTPSPEPSPWQSLCHVSVPWSQVDTITSTNLVTSNRGEVVTKCRCKVLWAEAPHMHGLQTTHIHGHITSSLLFLFRIKKSKTWSCKCLILEKHPHI